MARFYFMEMNTRLQVEHPVTEMITGPGSGRMAAARGRRRAAAVPQDELSIDGHAIEARIYAEDPDRGFLPATGRIWHLRTAGAATQRCASMPASHEGDEITPWYDPMIAKLIVHGTTRAEACARMLQALAGFRILGVANNVPFSRVWWAAPPSSPRIWIRR